MARLVWTENAIKDLNDIAAYIAVDNRDAAKRLVKRVRSHVGHLRRHPFMGTIIPEYEYLLNHRQLVENPCRIFYKVDEKSVTILHVMRSGRILRLRNLGLLE